MSANTAHTVDGRGILLYTGEVILVYSKNVDLTFTSITESFFKGKKHGSLYLTSHRIIFLNDDDNALRSMTLPFSCINDIRLEQPLFGANYIEGKVVGQPGGNFEGTVGWKLVFSKGGCIDFGKALRQAVMLVQQQGSRPSNAPPPYVPPAGSYYAPPPAYYTADVNNLNGFQPPTHVFPDQPQEGTVFVFDQPPPYSGIPMQNQMYPDLRQRNVNSNADPSAPPPYPSGSAQQPPNYENATKLPEKPKIA